MAPPTKRRRRKPKDDESSIDEDSSPNPNPTATGIEAQGILSMSKIPKTPHPSVRLLDTLSFEILPEGFFVIVYGARRTGKTHAVENLLEQVKDRFDFAYLFSNTALLHKGSKDFGNFDTIRDEAKFEGFDDEVLQRIIERQRTVLQFNNDCKYKRDMKPNKTLLIFDDFVHDKNIRYSKTFTELPVLGRHMEISVICLSQGYSSVGTGGLNKATRNNADLVMTFLPRNLGDVEMMSEWYLTQEKVENMWLIKSVCQQKHTCIGIDLNEPHLTEFHDYCTIYCAPPTIPKYELGKVQWKLYHEERKRQKKAALAETIDNEKPFHLTLGDLEKRARIGEATGLPSNRGAKPSLFDALRV